MTTEPGGVSVASISTKSPKHVFYIQLDQALNDGGFDKHMGALCKPFIADAVGPSWWSTQPSSYFRILFVGYLEGIESEQELCWQIEESLLLRGFVGFEADTLTPDPSTLALLRQPLLPLIHSEAFDTLLRIVEKTGLLEGRMPGLDSAMLVKDTVISGIVQRLRSKDHQNYWKRLTRMPGASWAPRLSVPAPSRSNVPRLGETPMGIEQAAPFALWSEDLSLAQAELLELRNRGVTDYKAYFAENGGTAVDHVVRACVYGRGPASVQAFLSGTVEQSGRELPQQVTAESIEACKAIAVALAEGKRQCAVEVPLLDAAGQPALALIQLAVQPGSEDSLGTVLVSFTDTTGRTRQSPTPREREHYVEEAIQHSRIGVWEWDITNDVARWSDTMLRIYGIHRDEFTGHHSDYLDNTYPEDREIQRESVRQSIADGVSLSSRPISDLSPAFKDFRIRRKDGQIRWVRGSAIEMVDDQGRPVKMQGVLWDITQSKQVELQLKEDEERFRHMVENAALPIVVEAFDGEVIYANDSAISFFQIERDDLSKLRATDYWEEPAQRAHAAAILAESGELRAFEAKFRTGGEREPHVALMAASVIEFGGRNVILCHHQEITFAKCIEDQLRTAQQESEERLCVAQQQAEEQLRTVQQQAEEQLRTVQQQAEEQSRLAQQQAEERLQTMRQQLEEQMHSKDQRLEKARQQADEQSLVIRQKIEEQLRAAQQQAEVAQQQLELAKLEANVQSENVREQLDVELRLAKQIAEEQLRLVQQQHADQQRATQQQVAAALAARTRELNLLKQMVLVSEQEPTKLIDLVCRELAQTFELPTVLGALSTVDGTGLGIVAERIESDQPSCVGRQLALAQDALVELFSEHPHPVWIGDASSDERAALFRELVAFEPKAACLLLPLVVDEEIVGLLVIGTGVGRVLDAETLSLIGSITSHVARTLTALGTSEACNRLAAMVEQIREVVNEG